MEHLCHVTGMLDRDQRTAKLRFLNSDTTKPVPKSYSSLHETPTLCCRSIVTRPSRSAGSGSLHLSCRNGYLLNTFQSVKSVLVIVCVTLVILPSTNSAPICKNMDDIMSMPETWINPCGIESNFMTNEKTEVTAENLSTIANQAGIALIHAEGFKSDFAKETFNKDIEDVHKDFKDQNLEWLNLGLPKSLGEDVPEDHIQNLKVDDTLLDIYEYLQKVAVGMQQVVHDQKRCGSKLQDKFTKAKDNLKTVLCEIQEVLVQHGIPMRDDVKKTIFSIEEREKEGMTGMNLRNWLIYREYINTLEYITKTLPKLTEKLSTSES